MLRVDINLLFTIINLLVLFVAMKKFLFKPVQKIIEERQAEADKQFSEADAKAKEADELKAQYEDSLLKAETARQEVINEAKKSAEEEYKKIITKANEEANELKTNIVNDANEQKAKIIDSAKKDIADMVVDAAAKVVGANASSELDSSLYDKFLGKAGDVSGK